MVELAVLMPVVVLLALGMVEASRMCMVAQLLTNAARDGCRVAVSNGSTGQDVTACINSNLSAAGITPSLVTISLSPSSVESTVLNDPITVTLTVDFSKVNWLKNPFFFKTSNILGTSVMLSQRP